MGFAIETTGLSKSFGHVRAADSVSLCVGHGEIYGFVGLTGAGKTTTIRALSGMIRNFMLMPFVALFASAGRGYPPPLGWAVLTLAFAQIAGLLGWGDWFPWSVPSLVSGMLGPRAEQVGMHSYVLVSLTFLAGLLATFAWWQSADQAR
jgi:ABC-type multidrug transport system, ATPase component